METIFISEVITMSLNVSSQGLNSFNKDWFTVEGPYAKVKNEYADLFFETRDKMHEAQKAVCAQAREKLVDLDGLTQEQIKHLSATYDPKHMSYEEYRSFISDLCEYGYFAQEDKPLVSCGVDAGDLMMIPVSYSPQCQASLTAVAAPPGYDTTFPIEGGDALAWTKYMSTFGTFNPSSGAFEKTEKALLFEKLQKILLQM